MKQVIIIFLVTLFLYPVSHAQSKEQHPTINKEIITLVYSVLGTKVGRGECWDLANFVLSEAKGNWNGKFDFGKKYNPKNQEILRGDIIQFENAKFKYRKQNRIIIKEMGQHIAIVYEVLDNKKLRIAEQNADKQRVVKINKIDINTLTEGNLLFYRPKK